jgi:NAD(P)-dependent dehydrogenase (short-subunit alcohol dehydrogenase family)
VGELDGKVAVVAGAGPGIGRACAEAFLRAGAKVVVAARNEERLRALADELGVHAVSFDLGDVASCRDLIAASIERFGGVDMLVNEATQGGGRDPIDGADWDDWRRAFEINVIGTLELSRSAARSMSTRGGGSIIQIGTFGTTSLPPRQARYTATKEALVSASMTLAKELGPANIRVNVVTPGYTTGPNLDALFGGVAERTGESPDEVSTRFARTADLRRHVDPDDIAEAVLFLAGPRGRNITGVELPVTAGQH